MFERLTDNLDRDYISEERTLTTQWSPLALIKLQLCVVH